MSNNNGGQHGLRYIILVCGGQYSRILKSLGVYQRFFIASPLEGLVNHKFIKQYKYNIIYLFTLIYYNMFGGG